MPTEMNVATRIRVMAIAPPSTARDPVTAKAGFRSANSTNKTDANASLFISGLSQRTLVEQRRVSVSVEAWIRAKTTVSCHFLDQGLEVQGAKKGGGLTKHRKCNCACVKFSKGCTT